MDRSQGARQKDQGAGGESRRGNASVSAELDSSGGEQACRGTASDTITRISSKINLPGAGTGTHKRVIAGERDVTQGVRERTCRDAGAP